MIKRKYHLIRKQLPNGIYLTIVPELPGLILTTRSLTREAEMLPKAIAVYLALANKQKIPLPPDDIYNVSRITIDT